jgi:NitT/TauT family transport system substrate-binding protein
MNGIIEYIADIAGSAGKISLPSVSGRVEQLLANQIDLTVVPEPYGSMAVQNGAVMIATDADLGIQAAVMAFDETAIDGKSDAIMAFYAGYRDSLRYLQTANPDDYIGFVTEKGEFAAEIGDVLRSMAFNPLQTPGEEQYEAIVNWMIHNGELTGGYEFAFTDIIDFSFYEAAVQH